MRKYLIDTEFIRATKDRVHFIEVAMLSLEENKIVDFHLDANLNNWEHRYFTRAVSGHYGERTQKVFEAVEVLYSGMFNKNFVDSFCREHGINYKYRKLNNIHQLLPHLDNAMLYAWDISNDKDLFKIIKPANVQLVDVQAMWREKFQGNQLSLIDAYKTVIYNQDGKDTKKLIDYAHYACCDVMLLEHVINFIISHEGKLKPIPVEARVRDQKVEMNNLNIEKWIAQLEQFDLFLSTSQAPEELQEVSRKLIRTKRKIASAQKRNTKLMKLETYVTKWW